MAVIVPLLAQVHFIFPLASNEEINPSLQVQGELLPSGDK